jgi:hypothetical protein
VAQATSIGTALAIHQAWNDRPLPGEYNRIEKISWYCQIISQV